MPNTPQKYYAVYLRQPKKLLCDGTARECAEALGMKLSTFYALNYNVEHGLNKRYIIHKEDY